MRTFFREKNKVFYLSVRIILLFIYINVCNAKIFAESNQPTKFPDRIILNLGEDASSSVSVTWRTDLSISEGECELHPLSGGRIDKEKVQHFNAKSSNVNYAYEGEPTINANQHSFTFNNLKPGAGYLYRVGTGEYWSEWFEFHVPSKNADEFSFVYFGDPQADLKSQWSRVVRKAYDYVSDCSFMLYGGDIINRPGRDSEWNEWFYAGSYILATVPQVLTPGNHDYDGYTIDPHWKYQFTQPQNGPAPVKGTCFFIDYKNLKIISIDSAADEELESDDSDAVKNQEAWLDSVLTANTKEWVVVTTHLPFYSPKESRDNPLLRRHFQPILEKHNVDLVLCGHDHSYGRGTKSDSSENPSIIYVVSVSGPKLYEAGNKDWMKVKGSGMQLFQQISIDGNQLHFKAVEADGEIFDEFMIKKKDSGKSKFIEMNKSLVK